MPEVSFRVGAPARTELANRPPFLNQKNSPSRASPWLSNSCSEMRMYRVLVAVLLGALAVAVTGCTGSLRLGSNITVVSAGHSATHA